MKKKLTITIDAGVLSMAKQQARSRGISLSSLIEQRLTETEGEQTPSFTTRWRGQLRATRRNNQRHDALAGKYLTSKET